jgi:hypothetical protein
MFLSMHGVHVVGSRDSGAVWALDRDTFDDDGALTLAVNRQWSGDKVGGSDLCEPESTDQLDAAVEASRQIEALRRAA